MTSRADGRLTALPAPAETARGDPAHAGAPLQPGIHPVPVAGGRDALLFVPPELTAPSPLVVLLHGAGGTATDGLAPLLPLAGPAGVLLLAPTSRGSTWDAIRGGFGPDVAAIDASLRSVVAAYPVGRVGVGGFSDGASYALSLGLTNGDLVEAVIAFSPGFLAPGELVGRPRVFVSHGVRDAVLPIDRCSRRIVPALTRAGYDVSYREFDGPHTVPPDVAREALDWWLA